jgi:hypothetical protein
VWATEQLQEIYSDSSVDFNWYPELKPEMFSAMGGEHFDRDQ